MNLDESFERALELHRAGRLAEAERAYRAILAAHPKHAEALHFLGALAHQCGHLESAVQLMRSSIAIAPSSNVYANLGETLRSLSRLEEAEAALRTAVALAPDNAHAHCNLSAVLRERRQFDEALVEARRTLEIEPDNPKGSQGVMNVLGDLGDVEGAVAAGRRAVELAPDDATIWHDLGGAMIESGNFAAARDAFEKAKQIAGPSEQATYINSLSHARFLLGDYEQAWVEYEARFLVKDAERREFRQPRWDGRATDATVLLRAEQGYGDAIMFARYVPLCAQRARVIVECQQGLVPLMRTIAGAAGVYGRGDELPSFDLQIPLLSIPRLFGTTVETIPADVPYLSADEDLRAQWRERIAQRIGDARPRVGLAWAGSSTHINDHNRSMRLADLAPLADVQASFFSLQVGAAAAEAKNPPAGMRLVDLSAELRNFAETAALVAELDLVIGVDTSVVHVAGALAKPVWTMLPFAPDWRWLPSRPDDTPWYPTMRLFRQSRPRHWSEVAARVKDELGRI